MSGSIATSATGGSASSQADSMDGRAWQPRPIASLSIRVFVLLVPLVVCVAAVKTAIVFVSRPDGQLAFWTWMAALVAVSFVASIGTQRIMRRVAPLAVLLKMSLIFPDEAPSRFRAAIRAGSPRSLVRRLQGPDSMSSPEQVAAEELVALMARLSRHDRITRGHAERVRAYSVMLGEQIGLSSAELERLNWAALVHDIGKLEVPASLLNKNGRPTDEEWTVLRTHPGAGNQYVEPLRGWLGEWVDAVTQHHERYDGNGYPQGLSGKNISLAGRIVSIADAYDVMTAARSYKKPLPAAQARAELTRNSGTHFDPQLVRSFLEISLGRSRRMLGGLGWLAQVPDMIRTPLTVAGTATSAAVAAGAIGLAAVAGTIAPPAEPPTRSLGTAVYVQQVEDPNNTSTGRTIDPVNGPNDGHPQSSDRPGGPAASTVTTTTAINPTTTTATSPTSISTTPTPSPTTPS
ncbi:MAG: HD-GYP domain-containing protein, partial [Actinomycetota bacterium]|nr:HD-GYP domain-containing protein [Actinomycetota bacterium]